MARTYRMCHCITPQALLSGLVRRALTEGYEPTRADVEAVLNVGCERDHVLAMFDRVGGRTAAFVREIVAGR
jgi:hypothetical protein